MKKLHEKREISHQNGADGAACALHGASVPFTLHLLTGKSSLQSPESILTSMIWIFLEFNGISGFVIVIGMRSLFSDERFCYVLFS